MDIASIRAAGIDPTVVTTVVNSKKLAAVNDVATGTVAVGSPLLEVMR